MGASQRIHTSNLSRALGGPARAVESGDKPRVNPGRSSLEQNRHGRKPSPKPNPLASSSPIGWPPPPPIEPRPVAAAAAPAFIPTVPRFVAAADSSPSRKQARSMTRRRAERAPPGHRQAPPALSAVRLRVSGERRAPPLTSTTRRRASLCAGRTG
jgi:hypothetical protein